MNVTENIANGDYDTKLAWPAKINKPLLARNANSAQALEYANALALYEVDMAGYHIARNAYNADVKRLQDQFRADLEAEYGMIGHPKADKLWAKAWDMGHSAGLGDVANYYDDLYELVA